MADPEIIKLGDPDPGIKPNTWPKAHRVWVVDDNRTHADGYLEDASTPTPEPTPEPEPEREPITVTRAAGWSNLNNYVVGNEVFANVAHFEGGLSDTTTYRYRTQTRATADDSWVNSQWTSYTNHALEVGITLAEVGQIKFQCQARDTSVDPVEQVNSFAGIQTVTAPDPLVVSTPVVTGEPYVGQTLACSEPIVSGGIGPYQIDYFWVDESNVIVWEAAYMGNTTMIVSYDIGKNMKCLVTVTDKGYPDGETITIESNSVGPIQQPSMGQPSPYIDNEIYDPNALEPSYVGEGQSIELRIDLPNNEFGNPSWTWTVRQGSARLSPNGPYCVAFNETAMGNPLAVQVDMIDNNCSDSPHSIRYTMFVNSASEELES